MIAAASTTIAIICSSALVSARPAAAPEPAPELANLLARGLISVPSTSLSVYPVFKDVSVNEVCGYWISRGDNGTANSFEAQCSADSECFRPGVSRMGLCIKTAFTAVASTSNDGTVCGYDVRPGSRPDDYYAGELVFNGCPPSKACKIANKGDLTGSCLNERGDSLPPSPKDKIVVAKIDEKCGTYLESEPGKGVRLVRARCTSGSSCSVTAESPNLGKCLPFGVATGAAVSNDGTCGYMDGYAVQCFKGNCIFPDNKSLIGFCPEWTAPTLPTSTFATPTFGGETSQVTTTFVFPTIDPTPTPSPTPSPIPSP
ncbi:hypothetical protein HDU97_002486 [Phlyctochytrium planicorne]|nr:hypothetical protein HDU97_002486 [Phlyctochytrium planicorne]